MTACVVQELPLDQLTCRPQVRAFSGYSEEEIAGLARSIEESGGILVPLLARRDGDALIVLDGERRLRAARQAGLTTVPVLVLEQPLDIAAVMQRQLALDAQRVNLSPIERARAMQKLMDETGWSAAQVAFKLGLSPAQVSKLLTLLVLPESVQGEIAAGRLPMSTAYEIAREPDPTKRQKLTVQAVEGGLSRSGVVRERKALSARAPANGGPRAPMTQRPTTLTLRPRAGQSLTYRGPALSRDAMLELFESTTTLLRSLSPEQTSDAEWHKQLAGKLTNGARR